MKLIFALTILFLSITTTFAFEDEEDCNGESGTTRSQACIASQSYRSADKLLNVKYKKVISTYKKFNLEKETKLLIEAQRAWIQYRDKLCEFEDQAFVGINSISWGRCMARVTQTRLNELNDIETEE